MNRQKLLPLVALVAIWGSANALASNVKVIVNSSVSADTASAAEIKRIFLEQSNSLAEGTHVEPVLQKDGTVHQAFVQEFLSGTDDDLQTYYRTLVFSGRGSMPKQLPSDTAVVAYVSKTRGAIGYVGAETNTDSVKVLTIVSAGNTESRKLIKNVEPQYPETLKRLNISGTVRLKVIISAKGNVEDVRLLGGNPILGDAAIAAVKQWIYAAGHSRTTAEVTIPFDSHR
jgi:TonB family protein